MLYKLFLKQKKLFTENATFSYGIQGANSLIAFTVTFFHIHIKFHIYLRYTYTNALKIPLYTAR